MSKKKKQVSLLERMQLLDAAGIRRGKAISKEEQLPDLNNRIQQILRIIKDKPTKATQMTYLIMYDIGEDKVRKEIAKYLLQQGCVRIQKSVYLAKTASKNFQEIHDALKTVNSFYANEDSIILVPINASDVRSMKLIGKNINISTVTNKPNTLFF